MDVDTLEPGVDFVDHIRSAVGSADVLLVVIGRGWLSATDLAGGRRLDDPKDFVRLEIGPALRGSPVVIPVLVGGAAMPAEEDLPADLALLARRNAVTLVDADWRLGLARLIAALRRIVEPVEEPEPAPPAVSVPPAVLATERSDAAPAPIPVLATILAIAGAVALVAGTWLQAETWAHPSPSIDRDGLGFFTSVAPMTIAVGAVGSLLLSYSRGTARIATGLFLGFALAGVARYVSLLGVFANTSGEEASRLVSGAWAALLGCGLLVAAAGMRIAADREQPRPGGLGIPRMLVIGGAVLVVVGTTIPFTSSEELNAQTVFERNGSWRALELIGTAAFAVAASLVLARARTVASGALIALGAFLALLWAARYVAFPALAARRPWLDRGRRGHRLRRRAGDPRRRPARASARAWWKDFQRAPGRRSLVDGCDRAAGQGSRAARDGGVGRGAEPDARAPRRPDRLVRRQEPGVPVPLQGAEGGGDRAARPRSRSSPPSTCPSTSPASSAASSSSSRACSRPTSTTRTGSRTARPPSRSSTRSTSTSPGPTSTPRSKNPLRLLAERIEG